MLRAGQRQIFQETNVRVVELRHLEIDYYFTVNAAIGTQSVLIGGFAYGLFTKNTNNGTDYGRISLAAFYVTSAITIFASIHVVVMSLLLQVYGPGLALHGPSGSMARAAEVMLDEQRQVMIGFIVMIVFFALSTVMCFWTAMDFYSACVCTGLFVLAVRQWLFYWRRVYFKLYWDRSRAKRMFEDVKQNSDEPFVRHTFSAAVKASHNNVVNNNEGASENNDSEMAERPSMLDQTRQSLANMFTRPSILNPRASMTNNANKTTANNNTNNTHADNNSTTNPMVTTRTSQFNHLQAQDPNIIVMEGYLTKKTFNSSRRSVLGGSSITASSNTNSNTNSSANAPPSQWERRYCVVNARGELTSYKSRQEYRAGDSSSLKERPLFLDDYWIRFDTNIPTLEDFDDSRSVVSTATSSTKVSNGNNNNNNNREMFRMTLISKDTDVTRKFVYRCDTEEELEMWFEAIEGLLPDCIAMSDEIMNNNSSNNNNHTDYPAATNPAMFDPNQHVQGGMSTIAPTTTTTTTNTDAGSNSRRNSFRASFSLGSSKR